MHDTFLCVFNILIYGDSSCVMTRHIACDFLKRLVVSENNGVCYSSFSYWFLVVGSTSYHGIWRRSNELLIFPRKNSTRCRTFCFIGPTYWRIDKSKPFCLCKFKFSVIWCDSFILRTSPVGFPCVTSYCISLQFLILFQYFRFLVNQQRIA